MQSNEQKEEYVMENHVVSELMRDYIYMLSSKGRRHDGRKFDEYRPIKIKKNHILSAEGSCEVSIGSTRVVVGIKLEPGTPFPDTPTTGVLITNAELVPMASPTFEAGPPNEDSVELARVVDRGLRESKCINMEKLCIQPGEKVWMVFVDIHILDYDGNLFDASFLASMIALCNTKIPLKKYNLGEDVPLQIDHYPVECTLAKIGNALLVDPGLEEELVADARLTIAIDENGDICAVQKGNPGALTIEDITKSINIASASAIKLREYLKNEN